jgi:transposase-like protein
MNSSHPIGRSRRQHSPEFKRGLVALCQHGVSVSGIALAHGVNANLLRRWINQYQNEPPAPVAAEPPKLVAVHVDLPADTHANNVIECESASCICHETAFIFSAKFAGTAYCMSIPSVFTAH